MKTGIVAKCLRQWRVLIGGGIIMAFLISCASPVASLPPVSELPKTEEIASSYQLGAEDVIEVQVWKNPDLSRGGVIVRPDGKISLPLIGDVQVAGLTADEVKESIKEQLKAYYQEPPEVSVIVQQINSYAVYISGEVVRPGRYVVKSGTTFLQAMTLVGGFTPFADSTKITLLRKGAGDKEIAVRINYKEIVGGKFENNIVLKPGDTIIVP